MTVIRTSLPSRPWRLALAAAVACAGCAAPADKPADGSAAQAAPPPAAASTEAAPPRAEPAPLPVKGLAEQEFDLGVKSYEDGDYKAAARHLQAAVNFGLPAAADRATAHKYLAFVSCTSREPRVCRDEFRKALAEDAAFDLTAAEAGHPIWGPVFRAVKAEAAPKAKGK